MVLLRVRRVGRADYQNGSLPFEALGELSLQRALVRQARIYLASLERFIKYVKGKKVWITRRIDIARHWLKHNPHG